MKENQLFSLNALKFVMIIFVVFIHMNPRIESYGEFSMWINQFVQVAVPVFFILSGFFFFRNGWNKNTDWQETYKSKIGKRIYSLLIPYLIWNVLPIINYSCGNIYSIIFKGKKADELIYYLQELWSSGLWHIWWDKYPGELPYNFPLWYVRDLVILCIVSPLIFFIIKKCGWLFPLFLSFVYVFQIWGGVPGFQITGILFFVIGSTCALKDFSLTNIPFKNAVLISSLFYLLSMSLTMPLLDKLFILFASIAWIGLFSKLQGRMIKYLAFFSESVFFIYAIHASIIMVSIGKLLKLYFPSKEIVYVSTPLATTFVCIMLYYVLKKLSPDLTRFLCGGR